MRERFTNNVPTTLTSAVTSTSQTSFTIADGRTFPKLGQFRLLIGTEIVIVSVIVPSSGTNYAPCTLTVTRGVEGTTPATYASGTRIDVIVTAGALHGTFDSLVYSGTVASLGIPAFPMFIPTDSFYTMALYDGVKLNWMYNGRKMTIPDFTGWFTDATDNNLTLDTSHLSGILYDPGGNYSVRSKLRVVPSTPYTMTVAMNPHFFYNTYANVGLLWRATSQAYMLWGVGASGGGGTLRGYSWSSPSNFAGEFYNAAVPPMMLTGPLTWMRLADDGVNKTGSISSNGINWTTCWSMSHTNSITPAYIGVQVSDANTTNMGETIVHMEFS